MTKVEGLPNRRRYIRGYMTGGIFHGYESAVPVAGFIHPGSRCRTATCLCGLSHLPPLSHLTTHHHKQNLDQRETWSCCRMQVFGEQQWQEEVLESRDQAPSVSSLCVDFCCQQVFGPQRSE